ncbi:reverse transcriptase domain-containing protein [Tanacetum coccineum]|uniref:Reverse transcriptase domain-containing protein n=1 Tax=Tanacetum coccineum TaxID=301880 RepID=A0ABQ4Y308_9ASTR
MLLHFGIELSLPALTKTRMILELADRTTSTPTGIAEDVFVKVGTFFFPADFVVVDYVADPRAPLILGRPFLRTARALIDVHGEQMTLRHDDQSVTFKVGDTKTLSYNIIETVNRIDVIDIACEEYVQEVLETPESGNPTSTSDLTIDSRSPSLTPFGGSNFLMEEIDEFLERDDSIPPGVDGVYDSEGDTVYLEELLSVINSDPNPPSSPVCEIDVPEKVKSSCEDPPDLELKDLPSHLEVNLTLSLTGPGFETGFHCVPKKGGISVVEKCFGLCNARAVPKRTRWLQGVKPAFVLNWGKMSLYGKGRCPWPKISKLGLRLARQKLMSLQKLPIPTTGQSSGNDAKPRLLRWILLLQEFDVEIRDKKGAENLAADHLSRLENPHQSELGRKRNYGIISSRDTWVWIRFRGDDNAPWFADFANYHAGNFVIKGMSSQQKRKFFKDVKHYF